MDDETATVWHERYIRKVESAHAVCPPALGSGHKRAAATVAQGTLGTIRSLCACLASIGRLLVCGRRDVGRMVALPVDAHAAA